MKTNESKSERSLFARYAFCVLAVVIATLIRLALDPILHLEVPFILYFPTIVLCAWFGGLRPGLFATGLAGLISWYVLFPPQYSFHVSDPTAPAQVVIFVLCGTLISVLAESLHRQRKRTQESEAREREERGRLHVTLASIGDGVIATDSGGRVTFMNAVAEELTGWKNDEASGQPLQQIFKIVNEHTRETVQNPALRAITEGHIVGLANHTVLIARNGSEIPIDDSGSPIQDVYGKTRGAVLIFRDITSRRHAEKERALLARIVDSSEDVIVSKSLDGIIESWNAAAEHLFGYAAAEAIGKPITLIVPPDRIEEEQMILERVRRGEQVRHFETIRVSKDGRRIPISLSVSPVRDSDGTIVGLSKIARDISERKLHEQELLESRERLRMAMEASRMGTWTRELDGSNLTRWSPELERIFGLQPGEFPETEEAFFEFVDPEDRPALQRAVRDAIENHKEYEIEFRYVPRGGGQHWMIGRGRAFYDESGKPYRLAGLGWDITERKRAEEALRQQREWLRVTLTSIGDAVIATDTNGGIAFLNPVAEKLTGWTQDEAAGRMLTDVFRIVNENTRESVDNPALRAMREGVIVALENHTVLIARDGTEIPIDDSGAPIRDADGKTLGAVLIFRDISERKKAERERGTLLESEMAARERAEAASRAKDEFVAMVSHELRSPLNAILGWASMLRRGNFSAEETAHSLEVIERNARAQVRIIDDLLDLGRVITGKLKLDLRNVDPSEILESAIESIRPAAEAKAIQLSVQLASKHLVSGDPNRLQQIVWNLLSNAVKFTPPRGRVVVRMERVASDLRIVVSDSGAGITPEFLPYVFDRFSQANTTTERKHGGLGLGLAIVRHLVELHGGTVSAESPGEEGGATFTVSLPVRAVRTFTDQLQSSAMATDRLRSFEHDIALEGVRVMIVDDDDGARELTSAILSKRGAEVRCCSSAAAAYEQMQTWQPGVLVCDIGMPNEDGYAFMRRLRALEQETGWNIPAVALTGYATSEDRMRALAAGFQMHVPKPVDPVELILVIATLAGRRVMNA
jgi:PAS domain S-box-containing protein